MTLDQPEFDLAPAGGEPDGSAAHLTRYVSGPPGPFARAAAEYHTAGWGVFPLPPRAKWPPPKYLDPGGHVRTYTGANGLYASYADVLTWAEGREGQGNVALRPPDGLIGLDVDAYDGKRGGAHLAELEAKLGKLPDTWRMSARADGVSGIYWFQVPEGLHWRGEAAPNIEIIQPGHRYGVAPPSIHPNGDEYRWWLHGGPHNTTPHTGDMPWLGEAWVAHCRDNTPRVNGVDLSAAAAKAWLDECREAEGAPCGQMRAVAEAACREIRHPGAGSRHDIATRATRALVALGGEGHAGVFTALKLVSAAFVSEVIRGDRGGMVRDEREARSEYTAMVYGRSGTGGAVALAAAKHAKPEAHDPSCVTWDDMDWAGTEAAPASGTAINLTKGDVADTTEAGAARDANTLASDNATDDSRESAPSRDRHAESVWTDAHQAELVADRVLRERFCWTAGLGWLGWDGTRWAPVQQVQATEAVRDHYLTRFTEEVRGGAEAGRRKMLATFLDSRRINAVSNLTRGLIVREAAEFDREPDLLNTPNGVIDLRTGELLPHDPARSITKRTAVKYEPGRSHRDWTKALACLPPELIDWYQIRLGQAVTGYPASDDVMIIAQGGGENGKTTLHGMLGAVLGDYYCLVSDRVLMADAGAHPTELMELRGARLAVVDETPEARHLNVGRLKRITSAEIEARLIRQNSVTFTTTHSLFLSTNYRPLIIETDHGTWRRLALLEFPYRFVKPGVPLRGARDREGDPTLRERLFGSVRRDGPAARAALAWLVEGAKRWYDAGQVMPPMPAAVIDATRRWRAESDQVLAYLDECVEFDPSSYVMTSDLQADVNRWLMARGQRAWSDKTIAARFGDHEEFATRSVTKDKIRTTRAGMSRSPNLHGGWLAEAAALGYRPEVPATCAAWIGIKFREADKPRLVAV